MARDYEEDLKIDKNALEIEWEKQADIYFYWAKKEAEALEERDRANQRLNIVQAEMDAKIRSNPFAYGLSEKTTETAIKNTLVNSKEYLTAENDVIEKNKIVRVMSAAVKSLDHKKTGLSKLSELWLGGYWSTMGGAPKEMKETINNKRGEDIRQKLHNRLKK